MGLFKERIMICLSMAFLATSALAYRLTFDGKLVLLALILLFCSFSILLRRGDVLAFVLLFLSVSAAILLSYVTFDHPLSGCRPLIDGQNHRIEAKVIEMASKTSYSSSLRLHIQTVDGSPSDFSAVVETAFPFSAKKGQTVTADVSFSDFEDMADSFPERIYEHSRGYFLKAECEADMTLLSQEADGPSLFETISAFAEKRLQNRLSDKGGGFLSAVLLGDRSRLSPQTKRDFAALGISHILAVSGLHLSIVLGGIEWVLRKLTIHKKLRCLLLCLLTVLFMGTMGFTPSVLRSGIMYLLMQLAFLAGRESDSLTNLFSAAALICLFNPRSILDTGFLLSVSATFGILVLGAPLAKRCREAFRPLSVFLRLPLTFLSETFCISLAATAFTLPITSLSFGEVSLVSPLSNLLFLPLLSLLLYSGLFLLAFADLPFFGIALTDFSDLLSRTFIDLSSFFGRRFGFTLSLRYPFVLPIVVLCVLAFFLLFFVDRKRRSTLYLLPIAGGILCYGIGLGLHTYLAFGRADVTVSNIKSSETFVITSEGECHLFDVSDAAVRHLNRALVIASDQYATRIDSYTVTHYHKRHIATVQRLCQSEYLSVVRLPYPADEEEENIASRIAEVAETEGTSVLFFEYGQPLPCGGVTATLKEPAFVKRSVQPMLTLMFKGEDASLLYTSAVLHEAGLWPDGIDPANLFLLFGKHGPLVKTEFPCRGAVYLTSPDLAPYAEGRYSIIDSRLTFRLSEGKK